MDERPRVYPSGSAEPSCVSVKQLVHRTAREDVVGEQPKDLVIIEGDFGSVKDTHPQNRTNQLIPHRSCSLHLIGCFWVLERRGPYLQGEELATELAIVRALAATARTEGVTAAVPCIAPSALEKPRDRPVEVKWAKESVSFQFAFDNGGPVKDNSHMVSDCSDFILKWIHKYRPECLFRRTLNPPDGCMG
jgi:hypothetical protein